MDSIEQIMARLAEATDEELNEALAAIGTEAEGVGSELTEDNVAKLERLAEARKQVLAERQKRQSLAERAQAARGQFSSPEEPPGSGGPGGPGDGTDRPEGGEGEGGEGGGEPGEGDGEPGEGENGDAVTASGRAKLGTIGKASGAKGAPANVQRVTTTTRSTGATASFNTGIQLDRWKLADALLEKHEALANSGVQGKQVVSRTEFSYPEERLLRHDAAAQVNSAKIEATREPEAIVAAGGLCAPLETQYDINVLGVTARPVRDALNRFAVDRGGIQYRPPMDVNSLDLTEGMGIWTVTDDANADGDVDPPRKTCAVIECPAVEEAVVYSTYLCLQYPNFTARFDREWVDATTRAALVSWSRFAENDLLRQILSGSKLLYEPTTEALSASRDVLVALDKSIAYYRNRHRLNDMVPLRLIIPRWVLDLFRADITRSLGSAYDVEAMAVADSTIRGWFTRRGVNVTFHLDGRAAETVTPPGTPDGDVPAQFYSDAAAGSAIPEFIDKIDGALFAEGDWLYLDGGSLDLGVVRDSQLNLANRYQTFVENWEGTAFNGVESLRLLIPVQPTGAVAGTQDTVGFAD